MCGFAALFSPRPAAARADAMQRMLAAIVHRGPDDSGLWQGERVTLGFQRLSILDLSPAGHQPMTSADGASAPACTIVFNGEIYNYLELRRELEGAGHVFRSNGDTEVLLHAVMQWGAAALPKLNGMFAFLVVDHRSGRAFGARDRFGIKPLYRWSDGGETVFASEIKSIRASGLYRDALDPTVVADYLLDGRLDESPRSFFRGIEQVPAAHCFELAADGSFRQWRWWSAADVAEAPHADPAGTFAALFEDAVRVHMRSDVPVAVHLSGGLDSTSIVCASARVRAQAGARGALKAFSFSDPEFDESRYIRDTIAQTGAELIPLSTSPGRVWNDLPRMLAFQDQPVHSLTAVIGYQLMALTKEHGIRVILNGQGADETLGGYPSYFRDGWMTLLAEGGLGPAWREVAAHAADSGAQARGLFAGLLRHALQSQARRLPSWRRAALARWRRERSAWRWAGPALAGHLTGYPEHGSPLLRDTLLRSVEGTPLPIYLRVEDRNSMAHSIEARVPFLDHRLVELAFGLGREWKLAGGFNKVLLREGMRGRIPESVRARRDKMGFPVPATRWLRNELHEPVRTLFGDAAGALDGLLDRPALLAMLEDHRAGRGDHGQPLFRAAQLLLWKEAMGLSRAAFAPL